MFYQNSKYIIKKKNKKKTLPVYIYYTFFSVVALRSDYTSIAAGNTFGV